MSKGYYIILEGGEGCGKDTQAKLLKEYFEAKGISCTLTREPGGTPLAEEIGKLLKDKKNSMDSITELFLFEAARANNYEKIVIPFRKNSEGILIKTRGWPSTFAYQGFGGGIDLNEIKKLNEKATQGHLPDLLIILDILPKKGLEKEVVPDRFAQKGIDYHNRVREGYLWIAKNYPDISVVIPHIEGIEKMQEIIRDITNKRLNL